MTAAPHNAGPITTRHSVGPTAGPTAGPTTGRGTAGRGREAGRRTRTPSGAPPRRRAVAATAALLVLALLAACSSHNQVPRSWIASQYDRKGSHYVADQRPVVVAAAIHGQASSRSRVERTNRIYLRYRNDIVAIRSQSDGGSRIEIDSYRNGHRRWNHDVGQAWPAPDTSGGGHRGGGSGSGGK